MTKYCSNATKHSFSTIIFEAILTVTVKNKLSLSIDILEKSQAVQYDPCCQTFKAIQSPIKTMGSSLAFISEGSSNEDDKGLFFIGGYHYELGSSCNVVICSQRLTQGHSVVSTEVACYKSAPRANRALFKFSISSMCWTTALLPELPCDICDAAVIFVDGKLYVIGGFEVKAVALEDGLDNLDFYMEPQRTVWILDTDTLQWEKGPELPQNDSNEMGYARGSVYLISNDAIVYSGGVRLKKNEPQESNQVIQFLLSTTTLLFNPIVLLDLYVCHERRGFPS